MIISIIKFAIFCLIGVILSAMNKNQTKWKQYKTFYDLLDKKDYTYVVTENLILTRGIVMKGVVYYIDRNYFLFIVKEGSVEGTIELHGNTFDICTIYWFFKYKRWFKTNFPNIKQ